MLAAVPGWRRPGYRSASAPPPADERKAKVTEAENELAEAEALVRRPSYLCATVPCLTAGAQKLRRMDLEARSLPVSVKTPLLTKLRDYKARTGSTVCVHFP